MVWTESTAIGDWQARLRDGRTERQDRPGVGDLRLPGMGGFGLKWLAKTLTRPSIKTAWRCG